MSSNGYCVGKWTTITVACIIQPYTAEQLSSHDNPTNYYFQEGILCSLGYWRQGGGWRMERYERCRLSLIPPSMRGKGYTDFSLCIVQSATSINCSRKWILWQLCSGMIHRQDRWLIAFFRNGKMYVFLFRIKFEISRIGSENSQAHCQLPACHNQKRGNNSVAVTWKKRYKTKRLASQNNFEMHHPLRFPGVSNERSPFAPPCLAALPPPPSPVKHN